jgi:hypothetical protein
VVALGKLGGKAGGAKGGKNRMASMSKEERSAFGKQAIAVRWAKRKGQ